MMDLIAQQAALFRAFLVAARNRGVPKRVLERAADKVLAGPDGALRFSNALRYVRLSMEVPVPLVPSWKKLTRQAVVLMDSLFEELRRGLEQQKPAAELEAIRRKIEDLGKEVRVAGVILGLLAPWKPRKGRKSGIVRLGPWEEHKHPRDADGKFTAAETQAVKDYSNTLYRATAAKAARSEAEKEQLRHLHEAMNKMPSWSGTVHRTIVIPAGKTVERWDGGEQVLKRNESVGFDRPTSASKSKGVALEFGTSAAVPSDTVVHFVMNQKRGRDISGMVDEPYADQEEVLLPAGGTHVISKVERGKGSHGGKLITVHTDEVGHNTFLAAQYKERIAPAPVKEDGTVAPAPVDPGAPVPSEFDFSTLPDHAKQDISTLSWDSVNPALRSGETNDLHKRWIERGDKLFAEHGRKLAKDAVLHRGLAGHVLPTEVGAKFTEAGYLRGSHLESEASGFAARNGDGQIVKINVPKGSTVLPGDHMREGEVYLPRGATLRVKKVEQKNNGRRVDGSYNVLHHIEADLVHESPALVPAAIQPAPVKASSHLKAIAAAVGLESGIAGGDREQGYIIGADGTVKSKLSQIGDAKELMLSPDEEKAAEDSVLTHNHPGGQSLSVGDFMQAKRLNMHSVRAVLKRGDRTVVHAITRPDGGWPDWDRSPTSQLLSDVHNEAIGETDKLHKAGKLSTAEARLHLSDGTSKGLARRLGVAFEEHELAAAPVPEAAPVPAAIPPVTFVPHRVSKRKPKDFVTVVADAKRLEAELAKDPLSYIPPGGGGNEIKGRIDRFHEFLKSGKPVEQPDAVFSDNGLVGLNDGRHRTRVLIDSGMKTIPLTVHKRDAAKVEERVGRQGLLFGPAKQVKWRFPWIQAAIDFLSSKRVIAASEFAGLSLDEQQAAFTAPGIEDAGELRKLRDELAGGVKEGESYANFQKRVGDGLALTRAQTETVFRTNIHQGYIGGFERCMETPAIEDAFPAVMFNATNDNRVRDTHWDLDGFVCLKSDPAYKVLLRALKDWNCRCSLVPVSRKQAESLGLKTFADLPKEVVAKYGVGLAAV